MKNMILVTLLSFGANAFAERPMKLDSGICVIDDFAGYIKRSKDKVSSQVKVSLMGSPPK